MAIVTSDYLANVLTGFRAQFAEDFQAAASLQQWRDLVTFVDAAGDEQETYTWFGTVPAMEDVTHKSVRISDLNRFSYTLVNKEYQNAMEVERAVLERDRLNLIRPRISQLAVEAARHPGELVLSLLPSNPLAFDGAALIGDSRIIGSSANIDNQLTGTGTSVAQFQTDLATARAQMRRFQDDQGRTMNLEGNIIMIPPELEQVVWQAMNANQGSINQPVAPSSSGGIYRANGYTIISNPFLTDVNNWYLIHDGGPASRLFIFQNEKAPEFLGATDPNSEYVIINRKFLYSAYGRYTVGVNDPRFVVLTTNS